MPKLHFGSRGGIYYNRYGRKIYVDKSKFGGVASSKSKKITPDKENFLNNQLQHIPERKIICIRTTDGKTYIAVKNSFDLDINYEGEPPNNRIYRWTSIYDMGNFDRKGKLVGDVKLIGGVSKFIEHLGKVGIISVTTGGGLDTIPIIEKLERKFCNDYRQSILRTLW